MKMKHKYFILYSNNTVETMTNLDDTLKRQVDTGVISFIYDIEKNQVLTNIKGETKTLDVNHVE